MNNFHCLAKALEITAAILAIYQWCPSLGVAVVLFILLSLIDRGNHGNHGQE